MMDWPFAFTRLGGKRIHLGVTGSIAAYKALDALRAMAHASMYVSATLTKAASSFVGEASFAALGADPVYGSMFGREAGPFGHLAPGRQCNAFAVCPATANFLAKLAWGLADDMLSTQALAWSGPIVLAPAMNPIMWAAAPTQENWAKLKDRGHVCLEPEPGPVACGDQGKGRLTDLRRVLAHLFRLAADQDLTGLSVLVSLGPTKEHWDDVRFITNPSSGLMGACLAVAAWVRGADVTVVAGPTNVWLPPEIKTVNVGTAAEMHHACLDVFPSCNVAAMTAAVADFTPVPCSEPKFKKASLAGEALHIEFTPTRDILADMGKAKAKGQYLIGFAAEAADPEPEALRKLKAKNLDMIVANRIDMPGSGFGCSTNAATVLLANGGRFVWPQETKADMGWRVWDTFLGV